MTTVIDERVVEMRFNNEDFEKNVRESMSTLDKLKSSLNFDSGKSLENLGNASKKFSLSGITETLTTATSKFSALEIAGVTAIANITTKVMQMGAQLVKSLTIDQITAGFDKYAQKTSSVQTIMAATAKDFTNQAEQMEYVNEQMDKLMWFTDETSYNFLDMASNIGKFTNNGVKLDDAVTAMQGIAQWGGISGANVQEVSRAMYNVSQAMGAGAMKLQDWKSIENANMATMEFKQIAADTAVEMGNLQKVSEGVYQTMAGHTFTLSQFSTYLKDAWFTADVMVGSLSKYGDFTNILYEAAEATDLTATELLGYIDDYKAGEMDLAKVSEETGVSIQELDGYMKQLADETNDLGLRSFKASQEAKTFKEAIDSVKDAVSSQWMKTSELIFGDYLQAKALWTGLANSMWEVFAAEGERRNQTLEKWKERNSLIEAFVNVLNLVYRPLMAVRDAWHSMFPATAAGRAKILDELTIKFKNFTEAIQPTQKMLTGLKNTFAGVFSIAKISIQLITSIIKAIFPATQAFGGLLEMILTFTGTIGLVIQAISEYLEQIGAFTAITETIGSVIGFIFDNIGKLATFLGGALFVGIRTFVDFLIKAVTSIATFVGNFTKNTNILQVVINKVTTAFNYLRDAIKSFFAPAEKATTVVKKATVYYGAAADATVEFGTLTRDAGEDVKSIVTPLSIVAGVLKKFGQFLVGIGKLEILAFKGIITAIGSFFSNFGNIANNTVSIVGVVIKAISSLINNFLSKFLTGMNTTASGTNIFIRIILALFGALRDTFSKAGTMIANFFKKLRTDAGDSSTVFGRLVEGIKNFVKEADVGRIAAIALSIGLLAIVASSVKLATKVEKATDSITNVATTLSRTISGVGTSIKGTFDSLKKAIDQFSKRNLILETIMTFAKAFTMVALSLTVLSLVPTDKLLTVSGLMLGFVTIFGILTGVVISLSKKLNQAKFQVSFRAMAKSIVLLASSMAILALSVSILAGVKLEGGIGELYAKIGAAIVMLAGVVGAAIALSKFTKTLPKGAVLLLAMALAMRQLALAVKDFASLPVDNINDHWGTYIAIFTGLSLVLAASGHVKVTSAVALLALASAMKVILPAMGQIVQIAKELPYDKICKAASDNVGSLAIFFLGLITALIFILGIIEAGKDKVKKAKKLTGRGGLFSGIGGAFAGIGLGMVLIVSSIKKLHEIYSQFDEGELEDISKMLTRVIAVIGIFTLIITVVNNLTNKNVQGGASKQFAKIALLMVGLSVAVRIMVSAVKALSEIKDMDKAWQAVGMVVALGALLATVVGVSGTVQKAIPALVALMSATIAVGVLIGEIAILSLIVHNPGILEACIILGAIFVALNVTMRSLEKIKDVKAGPIFAILGIVAVVGGSLIALASLDMNKVLASAASMSIVMLSVTHLFKTISKLNVEGKAMLKKLGLLLLTTLALAPIAVALYMLAQVCNNGNWKGVLSAAAGMSLALIAIGAVLAILSKVGSGVGQLVGAGAVILMSFALIELALALKVLEGIETGEAAGKVAALLGIVSAIIAVFGLISTFTGELFAVGILAFAITIGVVAAAFAVFALALEPLAYGLNLLTPALMNFLTLDFATMYIAGSAMSVLAFGLGVLGLAGIAVGLGAIGLAALAGALYLLGLAAPTAAEGLKQLQEVDLIGIAFGLTALGLAGAAVGLLSPFLIAASVGITLFAGALLILNFSLQASAQMFQGFVNVLNNAVTSIKQKITEITNAFKQLLPDIGAALRDGPGGSTISGAIKNLVERIAGKKGSGTGLLGGISQALGWASPPKFVTDLMNDIGTAFGMNSSAASAAGQSGSLIGNAFGSNLATSVSGWLSSVGSGINSFFSKIGSGSAVISSMGSDLDSTGAQAEKFGRTTQKTGNVLLDGFNFVKDKVTNGLGEVTEDVTDMLDKADFLPKELTDIGNAAGGAAGGLDEFGDAAESAGKKGKSAGENLKDLKSTLEGQLDMFSKFEIKTGTSAQTMIDNMKSNIDGFASWSHRMAVLAQRFAEAGIDKGLYQKLEEMGPKGYETMNAFYEMSEEQLAEVKDLWATGLTLPESQANIVASGYQYMGEMAAQGFSNALDDHMAAHEAAHGLGKAALDGLSEVLEVHSPSKATERIGDFMVQGLALGILSDASTWKLTFAVVRLSDMIIELFNENLAPEKMQAVGETMVQGLFENALKNQAKENPIITSFANSLLEIDPVLEALTVFVEMVLSQLNTAFGMADENSNSEVFYNYGRGGVMGFANGISMNTGYVHTQIMILGLQIVGWLSGENFPQKFYDVGKNATLGFANGLADSEAANKVMENAQKIAEEAAKKMKEGLKESSPSKVTRQIGVYASEGLAIGIEDGASNVYRAAQSVTEGAIDMMSDNGRLQDILNNGIDLNPVITPMLDLSILQAQMADLNAMFGARDAYFAAQNGGKFSANPDQPTSINFTQNNYSPKELSRYDIYRNTKNQISMMKGVIAHA